MLQRRHVARSAVDRAARCARLARRFRPVWTGRPCQRTGTGSPGSSPDPRAPHRGLAEAARAGALRSSGAALVCAVLLAQRLGFHPRFFRGPHIRTPRIEGSRPRTAFLVLPPGAARRVPAVDAAARPVGAAQNVPRYTAPVPPGVVLVHAGLLLRDVE